MNKKRIRERRKYNKKKRSLAPFIMLLGAGVIIIAAVIYFVSSSNPTAQAASQEMGQVIQVPIASRNHVDPSLPPPTYASDPPAGGDHYPTTLPTKFYKESDLASLPPYPVGYLVHNLEHGYVLFWYNCQAYQGSCDSLMQQIQQVMNQFGGVKVIAFPWHSINVPVALTSWGRLLKLATPDQALMTQFVQTYRFQSPEPNSP